MTLGHADLVTKREHIPAHRLSLFVMSWSQISITGLPTEQQSCFPLNRGKLVWSDQQDKQDKASAVQQGRLQNLRDPQGTVSIAAQLLPPFPAIIKYLFTIAISIKMHNLKKKRLVLFLQYFSSVLQTAEVNCSGSGLVLPGPCRHLHAPESCLSRSYCPASHRRWWQSRIKSSIKIPDPS